VMHGMILREGYIRMKLCRGLSVLNFRRLPLLDVNIKNKYFEAQFTCAAFRFFESKSMLSAWWIVAFGEISNFLYSHNGYALLNRINPNNYFLR
ncbi:hypothetical protein, partial [Undibacterium crateris]|uniref:hypothetical protein n=1 Tax=Undibacterium crateris TaxID=2528175 RepID=UPI001F3B20AA